MIGGSTSWAFASRERVARVRVRQLGDGADVAADDLGRVHVFLADHVEDLCDPFVVVRRGVLQVLIGADVPGEHAEERDLADVRVRDRLEDERGDGSDGDDLRVTSSVAPTLEVPTIVRTLERRWDERA